MKKILALTVAVTLGGTVQAVADTVSITSHSAFSDPGGEVLSSNGTYSFVGVKNINFKVAGKSCSLKGSARGSVPMGCNYSITVEPNGAITGQLTAGNNVCTQSYQVSSSCK